MANSCVCRELASCGYIVIVLTHGDGSADYHPDVGYFIAKNYGLEDYEARNKQV